MEFLFILPVGVCFPVRTSPQMFASFLLEGEKNRSRIAQNNDSPIPNRHRVGSRIVPNSLILN